MESTQSLAEAYLALQLQLDEGVDEWIEIEPISRFDLAKEKAKPATMQQASIPQTSMPQTPTAQAPMPASSQLKEEKPKEVDFSNLQTREAIREALFSALPEGLRNQLGTALPALGDEVAEVVVLVDPPFREAVAAGSLEGDASLKLLRKSLQAIDLDIDASTGKEPFARLLFLPIFPWRMPQDRKFMDNESKILLEALRAQLALGSHHALIIAGSNLAGVELQIKDDKLWDIPAFALVSPHIMLREPLLKRLHWQKLLEFQKTLKEMMKL